MDSAPVRVCFVCSGNICRSPTAQVVFTAQARAAGAGRLVEADSAGIGDWHLGEDIDPRSHQTLQQAGYQPQRHRARQFRASDFAERDVVVALDSGHRDALRRLAGDAADPDAARAKIVMLRTFDPELADGEAPEVGDPYFGGDAGFRDVLDQIARSTAALLRAVTEPGTQPPSRASRRAQQDESEDL